MSIELQYQGNNSRLAHKLYFHLLEKAQGTRRGRKKRNRKEEEKKINYGLEGNHYQKVARVLWCVVMPIFEVERVIPRNIRDLIASWSRGCLEGRERGGLGRPLLYV